MTTSQLPTKQEQSDKQQQLQLQNIAHQWYMAEQRMRAKWQQATEAERREVKI